MLKHFGIDAGRGNLKTVFGPGDKDFITYPSYVAPGKELNLTNDGDFLDNLSCTINGEDWFFGELARSQNGSREFTKDKVGHRNTVPLIISSIAAAAYIKQEYIVYPQIVPLLPISDYRKQASSFEQQLVGHYRMKFFDKKVAIDIAPGDVLAFPECAAMAWNMLLNWDGELINTDLAGKTLAFLDYGWKTLNFCVIRKLQYEDSMSDTLPLGLYKAFTDYYKGLVRERDITPQKAETLFLREGVKEMAQLAQMSKDTLSIYWPDVQEFDYMYIGGYAADKLLPHFTDWPVQLALRPARANAEGAYKIAKGNLKD